MKKLLSTVFAGVLLFGLVACASNSPKETPENENKTEEEKVVYNHPFGIEHEKYQEILDKSLVSTGNNYRMKKLIEKLRSGEEVYIAALGGSVTEGAGPTDFKDGYAYQFRKKLVAEYTPNKGKNVYFNDAGLSGTPSVLGLSRYDSDVVQVLGHTPDLLIIEFCVNDGATIECAKAQEALIRNALEADPNVCVIELFSDANSYKNSQANIMPVATYYRVPQISIQDAVESHPSEIKASEFFADYVHPKKAGHEVMADCLMNLFAKVDAAKEAVPFEIPEDYFKVPGFSNFTRITDAPDENVTISVGSFTQTDSKTQTLKKTGKGDFPQNWKKGSGNDPLVVEVNCKAFLLTYKVQGSWEAEKYGTADVYVDGVLKASYNGGAEGGWNNCEARVLFDNATAENHKIEIKMNKASEKSGFTVLTMGYTK